MLGTLKLLAPSSVAHVYYFDPRFAISKRINYYLPHPFGMILPLLMAWMPGFSAQWHTKEEDESIREP